MGTSSPAGTPVRRSGPAGAYGVDLDGHRRLQLRPGTPDDVQMLTAMHERCSAETLRRRYHGSMPRLAPLVARALLDPADGWSVVAVPDQDAVAGIASYAPDREGMHDVGLLVEDRWQRQGLGTRLLLTLARAAFECGIPALTCATQPDNTAVVQTIRSAGFRPRIRMIDGLAVAAFSITEAFEGSRGEVDKPHLDTTTRHPVPPLHAREAPRSVHPVATMTGDSVRRGA
jgi:GNAT superfamily N-acetyltransferase